MKKTLLLILVTGTSFIMGCSNNNDGSAVTEPVAYQGMWTLAHVSGGIAGINYDYDGSIIWNFKPDNHTVVVVNSDENNTVDDFLETGTYDYSFTANSANSTECNVTLKAGNIDFGCFVVNSNTIIITQTEADGYVLIFNRIMTLED